ncbi:MAG: transporter [Syntrophaceae bacterium]|nr:transporter [Syntrophaceae bacterium]
MKIKIISRFLSLFFFMLIFFVPSSIMANEALKGVQLALSGVSADNAAPAIDDENKNVQTEAKVADSRKSAEQETKDSKQDSLSKTIEQELNELRQEIKKIRGESEARKKLEVPEEEKSQTVEDILSAAGRQYSLLKKGTVGLSYQFAYSYYSGDVIDETTVVLRRCNHNITNTISVEYALLNNLTLSSNFPFVYKYNKVGTTESMDVTDLGDISLGLGWQPFKAGGRIPATIFTLGVSLPTGSSPFKINYAKELPTGTGYYGIQGSVSLSAVVDPLVAFGNLGYNYGFPKSGLSQIIYEDPTDPSSKIYLTKVEPGSSISLAFGFGYALSYQASLNLAAQFSYAFGSKYYNKGTASGRSENETGSSLSSALNIGTGWRITPARSIYASVGIGLTNNDPDVAVSLKLPYEF